MRQNNSIGKIEIVSIREAFRHEAHDFTVWMAENIDALSTRLDLQLIVEKREQRVGDFSADLLCRDHYGNRVIIENQLERSDHKHLGQLVTYMGNLKANTAIWITPEPRPEHLEAITSLNQMTNNGYGFYLVKVEAIRVDSSRLAPLFTILAQPGEHITHTTSEDFDKAGNHELDENTRQEGKLCNVWCVYPRRDVETYNAFTKKKFVGLGFGNLGDLKKLPPNPESFKAAWEKHSFGQSQAQIRTFYPMFYSFVHRVKQNDIVIYPPTWKERIIYVGKIDSDYRYERKQPDGYADYRLVK